MSLLDVDEPPLAAPEDEAEDDDIDEAKLMKAIAVRPSRFRCACIV